MRSQTFRVSDLLKRSPSATSRANSTKRPPKRFPSTKSLLIVTLVTIGCLAVGNSTEFILFSNDNDSIYRTSLPLGTSELIGTPERGGDVIELIEADSVRLYAFERVSNSIFVLDRFSGALLSSAVLDQDLFITRRGFDLSPEDILYGVLPGMQLRTVNPMTGATSYVTNITGAARVEAIAFAPDGTLYASGSITDDGTSETLFTLSKTTGVLTQVGLMGSYDIDDLTFGPDGFLYGVDAVNGQNARLLRIEFTNAKVTDLGLTGVTGVTGIVAIRQFTKLFISNEGQMVSLRWPSTALGFTLQRSETLQEHEWTPVLTTPALDGDDYVLTFALQRPREFFRLVR